MNGSLSENAHDRSAQGGNDSPSVSPWPLPTEIGEQSSRRIEAALARLVEEVGLEFSALLDDSGTVLGWSAATGNSGFGDRPPVAEMLVECSGALAMGAFAAAQTLAAQLGGDASREMIHHAGSRSFHLTEVSRGVALFSVWSGAVAPGFLRDRAARAVKALRGAVEEMSQAQAHAGSLSQLFHEDVALRSDPDSFSSTNSASVDVAPTAGRGLPPAASGNFGERHERYVFDIG